MNRGNLRDEVYARLGETAGFFTNAQLNQWLQDGVDDLCLALEPLVNQSTTNLLTTSNEYALPSDLISIKRVSHGGSGAWKNLIETKYETLFDQDEDWEDDTATTPTSWYWRVNPTSGVDILGVFPKPTTAVTAGLRIYYSYRAATMSGDSSTTGLPLWLDRTVVLYALYRCRLKERDETRAAVTAAEYRSASNEAARKLQKHRKSHAPQLIPQSRNYRSYYQRDSLRVSITGE